MTERVSMSDLAYDIEQLYIEGLSPKTIAYTLDCPIEMVHNWMNHIGVSEDPNLGEIVDGWVRDSVAEKQHSKEELSPFATVNS